MSQDTTSDKNGRGRACMEGDYGPVFGTQVLKGWTEGSKRRYEPKDVAEEGD